MCSFTGFGTTSGSSYALSSSSGGGELARVSLVASLAGIAVEAVAGTVAAGCDDASSSADRFFDCALCFAASPSRAIFTTAAT
jgi:hypothetical protein